MKGDEGIQTVESGRGALLLRELKDLVDSFAEHRRKEVIKIIATLLTRLGAGCQSRQSAEPRPERESHQSSIVGETTGSTDLDT